MTTTLRRSALADSPDPGDAVHSLRRAALVAVLVLRAGTVAQLVSALGGGALQRSRRPTVSRLGAAAYVANACAVAGQLAHDGRPDLRRPTQQDAAVMTLLFAIQPWYAPAATAVSSWDAWAYGTSIPTSVQIGIGAADRREALTLAATLAAAYVASVARPATATRSWPTVVANTGGMAFGVAATRLAWRRATAIARQADRATRLERENVAIARENEVMSRRLAEHVQRMLRVETEHRIEARDREVEIRKGSHTNANRAESLATQLRRLDLGPEAEDLARRLSALAGKIRSFTVRSSDATATTLGSVIQEVVIDSPVDVDDQLAEVIDLRLAPDVLDAVTRAVAAALSNVERHSGQMRATVLARVRRGRWQVVIADSGRGYDPGKVKRHEGLGFDLSKYLAERGIDSRITAIPGTGVVVEISGAVASVAEE